MGQTAQCSIVRNDGQSIGLRAPLQKTKERPFAAPTSGLHMVEAAQAIRQPILAEADPSAMNVQHAMRDRSRYITVVVVVAWLQYAIFH